MVVFAFIIIIIIIITYTNQLIKHSATSSFLSAENLARIGNATEYDARILFDQLGVTLSLAQSMGAVLGFVVASNLLALLTMSRIIEISDDDLECVGCNDWRYGKDHGVHGGSIDCHSAVREA